MFAKVIVDVPAKQTDRAFDYIVPESMQDWIDIGSRVGVPFGRRVIQGFVVDLQHTSEVKTDKLKPLAHILDLHPPLTKELVDLARWMSRKYVCHEITALQSMIPGALKAKYERHITLPEGESDEYIINSDPRQNQVIEYVKRKGAILSDSLLSEFATEGHLIKEMLKAGSIIEVQSIKSRLSKKKVLTVYPPEEMNSLQQYIDQCSPSAYRQKQVLQYLLEFPQPIKLTDLMVAINVGAGTVKSLNDKGWLRLKEVEVFRDPYASHSFVRTSPLKLTDEQFCVFEPIAATIQLRSHQRFLLHGVTGSGKTEVYLQAIQLCLEQGREAIVLVPEISLTPQMVERFKGRFGDLVAVLHSRLSLGERYDEWRKIQLRKVKVAIGARSAIFAPFTNIGIIIIDEEHETSYKQEDSPKYHAADIAAARGKYHQAVVIMGSATPSLESFYLTEENPTMLMDNGGKLRILTMESRVEGRPLPQVQVIDMREELKEGNRSMFSRSLHQAIEDRLLKQEQIVLLLNRRGYSTFVMCRSCGYVAGCPHCDISLTYHQKSRTVRCHYCGYAEREKKHCPDCASEHIRYFGTGTQRVEEELGKLFPGIRVIRMDLDTTSEKGSHEKWLTMFGKQQADVLLGTQMVAKGLDFPNVTLVGVIAADTVLNLPDFRAAEKTFQLMTQVAGRAGRHQLLGEVFVQSYTPEHYSIVCASKHDYEQFAHIELEHRRQRQYPPYCRLILITLSHEELQLLARVGESLVKYLQQQWKITQQVEYPSMDMNPQPFMEVLGPVASPIPRIKDRYRFQCMVKYRGSITVVDLVKKAVASLDEVVRQEKLQVSVDVDPQFMM